MQEIIAPIDKDILKKELTKERFLRYTNKGNNEIYIINHHNSPNVMKEIGRLRELTFRAAGGGTGLSIDIDDKDTCENGYDQLIAWDPEEEEIIAGYRVINCRKALETWGEVNVSTGNYFDFSKTFVEKYLPKTIELGRSFVQPNFQPSQNNRKGIFSLDNLWDGLGALVALNPEVEYLFGKVTMYPHYNSEARDLLMCFLEHYFPDDENLLIPKNPLHYKTDISQFKDLFKDLPYKEGYRLLNGKIRELGENIPPLVNTYMNLSPTMKVFGTAINSEFGDVEETGILIRISDIFSSKTDRHIKTFDPEKDHKLFAEKRLKNT